jgi:hypothetical protein
VTASERDGVEGFCRERVWQSLGELETIALGRLPQEAQGFGKEQKHGEQTTHQENERSDPGPVVDSVER